MCSPPLNKDKWKFVLPIDLPLKGNSSQNPKNSHAQAQLHISLPDSDELFMR